MTSRHQFNITTSISNNPINSVFMGRLWNQDVIPAAIKNALIDPIKGHGLNSTKWKGDRVIIKYIIKEV